MKKIGLILLISLITLTVKAQNEVDALRYSQITFGGTARYMGLGGAFGALGADVSSFSTNPAGIALFTKSEISFTPAINASNISSKYNETTLTDNKYNFNVSNIGGVFSYNSYDGEGSGCFGLNFGFGLNRLANFNNNYMMEGLNGNNSILSYFVVKANGYAPGDLNSFDTKLAYDAYLLEKTDSNSVQYLSAVPNGGVLQSKSIATKGAMNELYLTFGGNYKDKLYIGGTFGFPTIRYTESSSYKEENVTDTLYTASHPSLYLKDFNINNYLSTTGSGFNFKFGIIYRPIDFIRVGVAVHTPSLLTLSDKYNTSITSNFYGSKDSVAPYRPDGRTESYTYDSPDGSFNYQITTPFRAIGSLAFIIGKIGLVSADYEFVDYSDAQIESQSESFSDANNTINQIYTSASNIRIGTEWRYDIFALRAGYALYGSPYKSEINDGKRTSYSAGFGIRDEDFFIDFAYVYTTGKEDYYLYNNENIDLKPVKNTFVNQNFLITLGLKF